MKSRVAINPFNYLGTLKFLYKWKIAPTKALAERFFADTSAENAYRRILSLHQSGYIESRYSTTNPMHVWQLSPKGFNMVRPHLPLLADEGFKSENVNHDLLVAAVHLGDWLKLEPSNVTLYSEQELRRYNSDYFPSWLPSSLEKRPDGYWVVNTQDTCKLIALEVEITQKTEYRYESTAEFYKNTGIDSILWAVRHESLQRKIKETLQSWSPNRVQAHNFTLINDFLTKKWNAPIIAGAFQGKTISCFLHEHGCPNGVRTESEASPNSDSPSFLQLHRSYPKSKSSIVFNLGDSFD